MLTELREYWKEVRSPKYLFPGKTFERPLSSTTIQKMCKAAVQKAGILKNVDKDDFLYLAMPVRLN